MPIAQPGQRNTRQREILIGIIRHAHGPLSVQELLEAAQNQMVRLGIATVYRTLKLLEESGDIQPVVLPGGETRWESTDRGHHHHFQCRLCSRVTDFVGCPVHVHAESIPTGFVVEHHELTLIGVCSDCATPKASKTKRTSQAK